MNLFRMVGRMFGFHARESSTEPSTHHAAMHAAIERQRSLGDKADRLNHVLQKYLDADQPFKEFAVDIFEIGQESRSYYGEGDHPPYGPTGHRKTS